MLPVLTITLNPALDITTHVGAIRPRQKLRCGEPMVHAGGGGVNVSRAIQELGGESRAFIALGGTTGERFKDIFRRTGISRVIWPLIEETRMSFAVTDDASGDLYRFVMPGPFVAESESSAILQHLATIIRSYTGYIVASGSLLPGMPPDFYARLIAVARPLGGQVILDTHGEALKAAATERPFLIRLNHFEAQELVGGDANRAANILARELVSTGLTERAIVTLGDRGAILCTARGLVEMRPPHVDMRSGVGAGDSFVAALTFALASGWSIEDAAQYGVAAAASAVTTEATALCRREQVNEYYAQVARTAVVA